MRIASRLRYSHLCNTHLLRKSFVSTCSTAAPAPPIHHETVTPLAKLLLDSIKATGPISVHQYMRFCLAHPEYGYYMKGDPLGKKGDFITSPEISQVFGELLAIWFLSQWQNYGKGNPIRIIELGPGRGTLMDDMLRTFGSIKSVQAAISSVHLVENSEVLRGKQKSLLDKHRRHHKLEWHDGIEELAPTKEQFTILVAHEFFDALPIRVYERAHLGFREVLVDANPTTTETGPLFRFVASNELTPLPILERDSRYCDLPVGTRFEFSWPSYNTITQVAKLLQSEGGGAGLVIDYGNDRLFSSSFRAIRKHSITGVFDEPGMSDLTANVDFKLLMDAVSSTSNVHTTTPLQQGVFLKMMGIRARLAALRAKAPPDRQGVIEEAALRLVDMNSQIGMGTLFKVMALSSDTKDIYPWTQTGISV